MSKIKDVRIIFLLASPLCLGLFSVYLGSDTNGDVWNYHWYNAWAFLHHHVGFDLEPAGAHSYLNPYLDVFNYILITRLSPWLDAFVVGTIHGLIIWPIYGIIKIVFRTSSVSNGFVLLLTILCLMNPLFLGEVGLSMHDNTIGLFALGGFFVLLQAPDRSISLQYFSVAAAGILLGAATGLKLTAAIYAITLMVVTPILLGDSVFTRFRFFVLYGFAAAGAMIGTTGVWDWKLYQLYGSPIFPFFNNIFHSPYAVTAATATRDMYFFREHGLMELFYPFYFDHNIHLIESTPSNYTMYLAALAYICIPSFIVFCLLKRRNIRLTRAKVALFVYMAVSYFLWLKIFGVSRYLIPTIVLFPVLIFLSFDSLFIHKVQGVKTLREGASILMDARSHRSLVVLLIFVVCAFDLKEGPASWGRGNLVSPYFSVDTVPAIKNAPDLILQGYPVGWIVPPINPKGHIIHAGPTLFHFETGKYFSIGHAWVEQAFEHGTAPILIFDVNHHDSTAAIQADIAPYGITYTPSMCKPFLVHMGGYTGDMRYCVTIQAIKP